MGVMGQIAADKDAAINAARIDWYEAEEELRRLQEVPIMQRTGAQAMAIADQRQRCGILKMKFERAERERFTVITSDY